MRVRSLRWLAVLGFAAIALGAFGYSVVLAQAVEKLPDAELPDGVKSAGDNAAPGWSGSGEHPGKKLFDSTCGVCHKLSDVTVVGPGFAGLYKRVSDSHPGEDPYKVVADFVESVQSGGEENYSKDEYFRKVQESVSGPGVQMSTRGNLPPTATRRDLLNVIDYIFRFREVQFVEEEYWAQVKLGRSLVSGGTSFTYGGPSCTGCHTAGADHALRGANVGPNIADTYVIARRRGTDEKNNYSDGLWQILSGPDAPPAHYYYKDEEGVSPRRPLTEGELKAVTTFFEQQAREVGTEQDSNYLPIFALLVAALGILVLEPTVLNILFVKEDHEFVDGPYKEEDHHHDEHEHKPEPAVAAKPAEEQKVAEEAPAAEAKAEESAPAEETKEETTSVATAPEAAEEEAKPEEAAAEAGAAEPEKPADEAKTDEDKGSEEKKED
ncbi:MAG: hypothetical protein KDB90_11570 [Planctomycetes bacterium]|nr:hypothetical protein [Planctomycetota bacterium]